MPKIKHSSLRHISYVSNSILLIVTLRQHQKKLI